jgi:hypothetical protein
VPVVGLEQTTVVFVQVKILYALNHAVIVIGDSAVNNRTILNTGLLTKQFNFIFIVYFKANGEDYTCVKI